jgi:MFS family permease
MAWIAASASLAVLTIAFGAPLLSAVALKPIAADLHTVRAAPSAAGSFTYIGAAFGGIVAGWLSSRIAIRWIVMFGAVMLSAGLFISASGGLLTLYIGHGVLMGLLGTSCMFSPLVTYVSKWFDRRRGAAVALISSGQSVSGALWPVLFQAGVGDLGWRSTMMVYGGIVIVAILLLAMIFLHQPPETAAASGAGRRGPVPGAPVIGLPPNVMMILLMIAIFCCCVPMSMPMQHVVAFCGDLGFASAHGAAMLSVLLGSAFIARMIWGALADKVGGLQTLFWSSLAQLVALSGFLLTKNEAAMFGVSAAFGFGLSGLLPAYVITIREFFPANEADWRVPTVLFAGYVGMGSGGWGAGAIYDHFGQYLPAFGFGIVLNVVNLLLLLSLVVRQGGLGWRPSPA